MSHSRFSNGQKTLLLRYHRPGEIASDFAAALKRGSGLGQEFLFLLAAFAAKDLVSVGKAPKAGDDVAVP
jgi:hypothetical protein